jgi:LPS sulfotransferase NodH
MSELLHRLRYPRPLITIRNIGRELSVYGRTWRRPASRTPLRFVIFSSGRTGSSLLMDLLNSHPDIECEDEILSHRLISVRRFLDARASLATRAVFGFKLTLKHLDTQGISDRAVFLRGLLAADWRIVHLMRRDRLRQAVSGQIARQRRAFHQIRGARGLRPGPFRIDPQRLVLQMKRRDASLQAERAALAGVPHLGLCYEDDLLRPERFQATLDRVFDFLGIRRAPVSTAYVRTSTDRLGDLVANLDEVRAALATTEYASIVSQLA